MIDNERLTIETTALDGYTLKCLCTFGRDGEPTDEYSCTELCAECGEDCNRCGIQAAINRLAEYENTGLSPSEIQKLQMERRSDAVWLLDKSTVFQMLAHSDEECVPCWCCSVCDWAIISEDEPGGNYCPNCGARMDGDAFEKRK